MDLKLNEQQQMLRDATREFAEKKLLPQSEEAEINEGNDPALLKELAAMGYCGIGTPEQARDAAKLADAVVVGSAIVNAFHNNPHTPEGRAAAALVVKQMVDAVKEI